MEETVSEAFLNNMSLMGIRLVDNEQKPVATGQTLQEIRNGKVDDEVSIVVKGDLDCNGIVNIDDLMYLYQYVSGCVPEGTFTDAQLKAADYADHDGVIDDKDLAELLNYINERGYEPGTKASASESQVGLNVRYLDSTGTREISKIEPGDTFKVEVSAENAENLTGLLFRLYYDKTQFETIDGEWSDTLDAYEETVCGNNTALSPLKDINYDKKEVQYTNFIWSIANNTFDNSTLTKGMGDIDLCTLTLKAKDNVTGEFPFSIERLNVLEYGRNNSTTIEEEAIVKNTLTVEERTFEPIPMTGFSLDKKDLVFDLGKGNVSEQINVTEVVPADTTDEISVIWSSSDKKVVEVDQKGNVTAKGEGTAIVSAVIYNSNNEKITQNCSVTVLRSLIGTWKKNSSGWWFEESNGSYPANTWAYIEGAYYYFNASGYMAANKWVGDYYVGADGARKTGWLKIGAYWYYFYQKDNSYGKAWVKWLIAV